MDSLGKKQDDVEKFQAYLLEPAPFNQWRNPEEVTLLKTVPNEGKHIVRHRMFSTVMAANNDRPPYLHTVYEATMLGKTVLPLPKYSGVYFEGQAVMLFIGKIAKVKTHHVFSTVERDFASKE